MGNNQTEKAFEEKRLAQTISLAEEQLKQAKEAADKKKSEIIEAKKDVRENTEHGITSLYTSDGFEALVELSQYINPVTDKIIDYEEEEHKILLLEKMIKSPYFARIDFKFDDEDEFEKIYIGRSSLRKNSYQEMYVYDWRSPIASVFYRFMTGEAFYDAPCGRVTGELNLKRQYEIKNGTLEYFFDSDVQIVDEFLRQLLSQNTTAKMKAIVERSRIPDRRRHRPAFPGRRAMPVRLYPDQPSRAGRGTGRRAFADQRRSCPAGPRGRRLCGRSDPGAASSGRVGRPA